MIEIHHQIKKLFLILFFSAISVGKFVLVDQLSKYFIRNFLLGQTGYIYKISSFFDLVYSWNYGISFGMFHEYNYYANKAFIVINSIIILYIWRIMFKATNMIYYNAYSFIIGGALGNLIDRILHGAVFDFLYFHFGNYGFPAFNLADSFIFLGVMLFLYGYYNESKNLAEEKEAMYDAEYNELADAANKIKQMDSEIAKKGIKKYE